MLLLGFSIDLLFYIVVHMHFLYQLDTVPSFIIFIQRLVSYYNYYVYQRPSLPQGASGW